MTAEAYKKHCRKRILCQTLGGNECSLLTITDFDKGTNYNFNGRPALTVLMQLIWKRTRFHLANMSCLVLEFIPVKAIAVT
jgi:hypothetical protein